jgi:hypothetical protein
MNGFEIENGWRREGKRWPGRLADLKMLVDKRQIRDIVEDL